MRSRSAPPPTLREPLFECATLRVRNAINGDLLAVLNHRYAVPRPFQYVSDSTTIRDVFSEVCKTLRWPSEFMLLSIAGVVYDCPRLLSRQQHLNALVTNLSSSSGLQRLSDVSYDFLYYLRMPENFQAPDAQSYCLCDFGGCCRLCFAPSHRLCWGCGNNGCCRCANCGCDCCVSPEDFRPVRRCPISGCRPAWACH